MKKTIVLTVLFALPIVAYLFFSSGINNFAKLPILTSGVKEVENFQSLNGDPVSLKNHITILSFFGNDIEKMEGNAFNLNEKIYDKNFEFKDFQFVVLAKEGTQEQARNLLSELSTTIDTKKWKFLFAEEDVIAEVFESLQTNLELNENFANSNVFIIDKDLNLRGRDVEESDNGKKLYGYNTSSVGELSNKMTDDIKVILAEYRLALKKYNTSASEE